MDTSMTAALQTTTMMTMMKMIMMMMMMMMSIFFFKMSYSSVLKYVRCRKDRLVLKAFRMQTF